MESSGKNLWVGIDDREHEGTFKYLNGQTVNPRIGQDEALLYYFQRGQPDNAMNEDCVKFTLNQRLPATTQINDRSCSAERYGLCEIKNISKLFV